MPISVEQFQNLTDAERQHIVRTETALREALHEEFDRKIKALNALYADMTAANNIHRSAYETAVEAELRASLTELKALATRYNEDYEQVFAIDAGAGYAEAQQLAALRNDALTVKGFNTIAATDIPVAPPEIAAGAPGLAKGIVYNIKQDAAPAAAMVGKPYPHRIFQEPKDIPPGTVAVYKQREYTVSSTNVSYAAKSVVPDTGTAEQKSNEIETVIEMVRQYLALDLPGPVPVSGSNPRLVSLTQLVVKAFKPNAVLDPAVPDDDQVMTFASGGADSAPFSFGDPQIDRDVAIKEIRKALIAKDYVADLKEEVTATTEEDILKAYHEAKTIQLLAEIEDRMAANGGEILALHPLRQRLIEKIDAVVGAAGGVRHKFGGINSANFGEWDAYKDAVASGAGVAHRAGLNDLVPNTSPANRDPTALTTVVDQLAPVAPPSPGPRTGLNRMCG